MWLCCTVTGRVAVLGFSGADGGARVGKGNATIGLIVEGGADGVGASDGAAIIASNGPYGAFAVH